MNTLKFETPNEPNAGKLIESLRHLGYDNYTAIADIVDNCLDADAKVIAIRIWNEGGDFHISIADNGIGMDRDILDQALKLGSLTDRDSITDLGKFGMGLVTAGLSLSRRTKVITKQGLVYLTSIVDIDEVVKANSFCKYLNESDAEDKKLFDAQLPQIDSGTIVIFDKCDGIKNRQVTQFAETLRKRIGRIHRYFIMAGKSIIINDMPVKVLDPLQLDNKETEIFSDDEYPVTVKVDGKERQEKIRVRIALIPRDVAGGELDVALGLKNQGFYIMRNNREIKNAETLDMFIKHNYYNRMRGEIFFTGDIDSVVGIDFTKREIVLDQSLYDQLAKYLKPQCTTIRAKEIRQVRVKESEDITDLHKQAEKHIEQKAKLLITPTMRKEKRGPRTESTGVAKPGNGKRTRENFEKTQTGNATMCKFETGSMTANGPIYDAEQHGRTVLIRWNVDHPFYERFITDQRSDDRLVTAIDFLIYSMAAAELQNLDDEQRELISSFMTVIASNVRTLLS